MTSTTLFLCSITVFLYSLKAGKLISGSLRVCSKTGSFTDITVIFLENYNLTWYKTGSQTSVAKDKHSRIHQQNNFIWFLPATLKDSGSYECVIRNLSSCRKIYMNLRVFKNIYGSCFNEKFAIGEEILTSSHAKVVCPHLDYFRDEENTLPLQWYKVKIVLFSLWATAHFIGHIEWNIQ
uniref:Interleukin 1 receptor like 2 n=1 Tax=Chelonoidis abingdonii TaxID=106734 RepID=A0A8C0IPE7_CHEAB